MASLATRDLDHAARTSRRRPCPFRTCWPNPLGPAIRDRSPESRHSSAPWELLQKDPDLGRRCQPKSSKVSRAADQCSLHSSSGPRSYSRTGCEGVRINTTSYRFERSKLGRNCRLLSSPGRAADAVRWVTPAVESGGISLRTYPLAPAVIEAHGPCRRIEGDVEPGRDRRRHARRGCWHRRSASRPSPARMEQHGGQEGDMVVRESAAVPPGRPISRPRWLSTRSSRGSTPASPTGTAPPSESSRCCRRSPTQLSADQNTTSAARRGRADGSSSGS